MLTTADLTAMRTIANAALPGTAVITGGTFASDGGGGGSVVYVAGGTVACRLGPIRGDEREMGERISPDADSIVTLPFNAVVTEDSRLTIDGDTYNVAAIRDRSWPVTLRVEVVKQT